MHSISVWMIVIYFLLDVFDIYIIDYCYFFLLGGLPLYGVHNSFVDYPNDDVVYCN